MSIIVSDAVPLLKIPGNIPDCLAAELGMLYRLNP